MQETAFSGLAVDGQGADTCRIAGGQANVVEFQSLDAVHCGKAQRSRVVNVDRVAGDLMNRAAQPGKLGGIFVPLVVRQYSDAADMAGIGFLDFVIPRGDVLDVSWGYLAGQVSPDPGILPPLATGESLVMTPK